MFYQNIGCLRFTPARCPKVYSFSQTDLIPVAMSTISKYVLWKETWVHDLRSAEKPIVFFVEKLNMNIFPFLLIRS